MYNKLTWTNPNGATPITVNIYRGTAPIDRANLTGLLVSLTAGEVQYQDNTAVRGTTYYYVFETISATDRSVSQKTEIVTVPRRGAGPNVLQKGDYNYGYFGSILSSSFINITALRVALGFSGGTVNNASPKWHKYARNGKVIFVPETVVATGVGWNMLYNAGLVFGTGDNGPYNAGSNVLQNAQVTIGPDTYRVRLMRGYNDDNGVFCPTTAVVEPAETFTCEWDDFVYPLAQYVPGAQRMSNVANLLITNTLLNAVAYGVVCQERTVSAAGTIPVQRGSNVGGTRQGFSARQYNPQTNGVNGNLWWPVLELIEPAAV